MTQAKHTPGPWTHRNGRIFQTDWEALTIANVGRAFDGGYSAANGDLIAAAPDLLRVAEDFKEVLAELGLYCSCGEQDCRTTRLHAALAKARGEASIPANNKAAHVEAVAAPCPGCYSRSCNGECMGCGLMGG